MFGLSKDIELCLKGQDIEFIGCILINHVNSFLIAMMLIMSTYPLPSFFYIKPKMGVQFLLHIIISLGNFVTEIYLT